MKTIASTLLFGMTFSLTMAQVPVSDTPSDKGFLVDDHVNNTKMSPCDHQPAIDRDAGNYYKFGI